MSHLYRLIKPIKAHHGHRNVSCFPAVDHNNPWNRVLLSKLSTWSGSMAIKHFKAAEHSPESASAFRNEGHLTTTVIDRIQAQSANEGHRLLPTVFTIEKDHPIPSKSVGPGALYVIEGVFIVEDAADPENPLHLTAGDVILVDEGTVHTFSTPSKARGFGVAYVPAPLILKDFGMQ